jgi:predicted DNA-binding protein (MmcQ/YjbR family)
MAKKKIPATDQAFTALRKLALGYPETREDHPWGHCTFKVRNKVFLFMDRDEGGLSLSLKLPQSREFALEYPFTEPTGYGLGKSGWVTASFGPKDKPPLDVLGFWLAESFRAIAPKKLLAGMTETRKPPVSGGIRRARPPN